MTRRHFGLLAAGGVASLALARSGLRGPPAAGAPPATRLAPTRAGTTPVALAGVERGAGDAATGDAVRRAAQAASDFGWLGRGDRVLIKPVCNSGNTYPATTDPAALRAMIGLLRERGAGRVIVADMSGAQFVRLGPDSLWGSTRELMRRNRMAQAAEAAGAEVHAFEEQGWDAFFEESPTATGSWSGPILLPKLLDEIDHVVLMPRVARHVLTGTTLGLKAAVGWWRHDTRLEYHRDAATLPEKTADANSVPTLREKQRLVVTSATRVLTTFGPDEGRIADPETGLVLASPSVVAHDMAALAWLLENRRAVPESELDGTFEDPHNSSLVVDLSNRMVTRWLGGFGAALAAETLDRQDLHAIWDDRVLRRAFQVFDGVPRVELIEADGSVPAPLRRRLEADLEPPA
jgi:uncharacterized protein (DUF362 family)